MAGYTERLTIAPELCDWDVPYDAYDPPYFTDPSVLTKGVEQGWADPEAIDDVDLSRRMSYLGLIRVNAAGYPLNPTGRTGLAGRGLLGSWGPNHAADPIVFAPIKGSDDLSLLLIVRKDNGRKALPGGMVDAGEHHSATTKRELNEEAGIDPSELEFRPVYRGYVGDYRNTDNAWLETVASYTVLPDAVPAVAGDDAAEAGWFPVSKILAEGLHATHANLVRSALRDMGRD